jgi:hypothetical protein
MALISFAMAGGESTLRAARGKEYTAGGHEKRPEDSSVAASFLRAE